MADYSIAAGARGAHAKTLTPNTVDTVTFTDGWGEFEIVSDGIAAVYVTIDGTAPTVAGANTDVLPAGGLSVRVVGTRDRRNATVVKVISAGAATYSVVGLR